MKKVKEIYCEIIRFIKKKLGREDGLNPPEKPKK